MVHLSVDGCDGAMKELFPVCGVSSHKEGRDRSIGGGGCLQRKTPSRSSLHLASKGQEERGTVAGRVHSVSSESRNCSSTKVCRTDAKPSLTFACLPAASLHTLGFPPIFTSPFLLRPLPLSVSKLSFPLGDVRSPQRSSTKPPLFIGSRWTRLTVVL